MRGGLDVQAALRAGKVPTFLDGNVWNYLFDNDLDIDTELPPEAFALAVTREGEMELLAIPDDRPLKAYILDAMARRSITVDAWFGFAQEGQPPEENRYGGFDFGRWASPGELDFVCDYKAAIGKAQRPSKLYKNEADLALGARAFLSLVLSLDAKNGPLRIAEQLGGNVCFLTGLTPPETIAERIRQVFDIRIV